MLTDRPAVSGESSAEDVVASGRVLRGRFVLEEQLEHGRLGVVFRATDRQRSRDDGAAQHVAVLVLPTEVVRNATQLETFKREFASVQALSHPNIVGLYDFDRDGEVYYVVMELVDGESLRNIVDSLTPELVSEHEALEVVRAVGEALLYAHASGIVHGDVRAENVVVTAQHDIKLMFASACLARSAPFSVDPRDDVYGLASLAYQLLSGEIPPAAGLQSATGRHRTSEPPRIKGLTRGRWNALRSGLAPRDKRSRSIRQFLAGIGIPERELPRHLQRANPQRTLQSRGVGRRVFRRAAIAAVAMGIVVAIVFGMLQIGPDRLAELPALVRDAGAPSPAETHADPATAETTLPETSSPGATGAAAVSPPVRSNTAPSDVSTEAAPGTEVETIQVEGPAIAEAPTADEPTLAADEVQAGAAGETSVTDSGRVSVASPGEPSPSAVQPARADTGPRRGAAAAEDRTRADEVATRADEVAPGATEAEIAAPSGPVPAAVTVPPPSAGTVFFSRRDVVATEGQSVVTVEITRPDASGAMSAIWWTSDGSAVAPDDYADFGRVVEDFADGERSRTVSIPITSDALIEEREFFYVNLSALSADGAQQGELSTATVTIVDDDR